VVAGQNRAREIVEAHVTGLAPVTLPVRLGVIVAVADDGRAPALRASNAVRPAVSADQRKAFRVVEQGRQVKQISCGHGGQHLRAWEQR
jgi:hypothetical protein